MPWGPQDVEQHRKGLNPKQKKKWAKIASGIRRQCIADGGSEGECDGKAIRIANSKFDELSAFNPVIDQVDFVRMMTFFGGEKKYFNRLMTEMRTYMRAKKLVLKFISTLDDIDEIDELPEDKRLKLKYLVSACVNNGGDINDCLDEMLDRMNLDTLLGDDDGDAISGLDNDGDKDDGADEGDLQPCPACSGTTKPAEKPPMSTGGGNGAGNPGMGGEKPPRSMKEHLGVIREMEIFRTGTHNGDKFERSHLQEIADNFHKLKNDVRPKLKITHRESQETLAGLASYGDIIDVYLKGDDTLCATVAHVPQEVIKWIQDRRFPERSIEIYPEFKVGTKEDSPTYKNVLKAIALLGREMPAVTGMRPVQLKERVSEFARSQRTVCFRDVCFPCEEEAIKFLETVASALRAEQMIMKSNF